MEQDGGQNAGTALMNGASHSEANEPARDIEAPTGPGDNEAATHAGDDEGDDGEGNDQSALHTTKKKKKRKPKSQRGLVGHPELWPSSPRDHS